MFSFLSVEPCLPINRLAVSAMEGHIAAGNKRNETLRHLMLAEFARAKHFGGGLSVFGQKLRIVEISRDRHLHRICHRGGIGDRKKKTAGPVPDDLAAAGKVRRQAGQTSCGRLN